MSGRAQWKGSILNKDLLSTSLFPSSTQVYTRRETIPSYLIDHPALVYNGKVLIKMLLDRRRVGFKFGSFSHSRKNTFVTGEKKIKKAPKK
jgi:ribosomal protein S19